MNPGRAPTPIGDDGIAPFVDLPHWFTGEVTRALRHHRVAFEIRPGIIRRADSSEPDDHTDRLLFPGARPEQIQGLIDSLKPPGFP